MSLRRVAELHFKNSMALQFLDRMPEALHAVRAARVALQTRAAQLAAQVRFRSCIVQSVMRDLWDGAAGAATRRGACYGS